MQKECDGTDHVTLLVEDFIRTMDFQGIWEQEGS